MRFVDRDWPKVPGDSGKQVIEPRPDLGAGDGGRNSQQFNSIHMLRGFAALWVVLFHIDTFSVAETLGLPAVLDMALFDFGRGGVAVFFVLSGFVIAHSLSNRTMNGREFGYFVARRSLRLDPPYFMAIALALCVTALIAIKRAEPINLPSAGTILAHMVYLQDLLHFKPISVVFWTLAYEFQFYLFFAGLQLLKLRLKEQSVAGKGIWAIDGLAFALAIAGIVAGPDWAPKGLFVNLWYAFYLGVCVQRAIVDGRSMLPCLLLAALMLGFAPQTTDVFNSPAALTGLGLLILGKTKGLSIAAAPRVLMWLGTISYSLYLTHYQILILTLIPAGLLATSSLPSLAVALQLVACLIAAQIFWFVIERPSQRWSKHFGLRRSDHIAASERAQFESSAFGRGA